MSKTKTDHTKRSAGRAVSRGASTGRFVTEAKGTARVARPAGAPRARAEAIADPATTYTPGEPIKWTESIPEAFLAEIRERAGVAADPELDAAIGAEIAMYAPANKWLEQVRLSRGLTQVELAHRVDRTQGGISQLETRSIAGRQLNTLAELLAGLGYALELAAVDATGQRIVCTVPPAE